MLLCACRNGQPLILTAQHRVYGFGDHVLEEIERVEAAGGWIVDGRVCNILAVSRAFGDPEFKVGAGPGRRVQQPLAADSNSLNAHMLHRGEGLCLQRWYGSCCAVLR